MRKGLKDKRIYKLIKLTNDLKALLIQDNEADKSSASVGVRVGAYSDPKEYQGLAHFCEHMLFMGTKKYSSINDFSEYLSANKGDSNAFTTSCATVYKFDCSNEGFLPALDKFAQFFISPIFEKSTVEKELKAIESENNKNLQLDSRRLFQLCKSESKLDCINNHFSTGNTKTINPNNNIEEPRNALIEFYNKYYHSNKMSLVIVSPMDVEQLESIVIKTFSEVPSGDKSGEVNYYDPNKPSYDQTNLGRFYILESVEDKHKLSFKWFLNSAYKLYKTKPLNYLSSLFGHEGKNSLYSILIKEGLITSLSASEATTINVFSIFNIEILLTQKGLDSINIVILKVLKFIKYIQSLPINKRFYEENVSISKISFDFKDREDPVDYSEELAYRMNDFEEEDILTGPYLFETYNETIIKEYLDNLIPEKMNIYLSTKNADYNSKLDKSEKWYGTRFTYSNFDEKLVEELKLFDPVNDKISNLPYGYPEENVFIPKDLSLKSLEEISEPKLIENNEKLSIWYKPDTIFNRPKTIALCQIYLNKNTNSYVEYEVLSNIWDYIINQKLKDVSYLAREADCVFNFTFNHDGIFLKLSGFSDSIQNALKQLVDTFKKIIIDECQEELKTQCEKYERDLKNFYCSPPYEQAYSTLEYLKFEPSSTPSAKLEKLNYLSKNEFTKIRKFQEFSKNYFNDAFFSWVIQGNLSADEAREISNILSSLLNSEPLDKVRTPTIRIVDQEACTNFSLLIDAANKDESNSCIVSSFAFEGKCTVRELMKLAMIESLIKEKFFDSLRTQQGLGYIVQCFLREQRKIPAINFRVQSNFKSPEYLWQKITQFIYERWEAIKVLDDETYNNHLKALISEKKEKDLSLDEEVTRNFNQVKKVECVFNIKELMIKELETLNKSEVIAEFEKLFYSQVRRADIMLISANHKEENTKLINENQSNGVKRIFIDNVDEYKRRNKLHPDYFKLI